MIEYSPQAQLDIRGVLSDVYQVSEDVETARRYVRELMGKIEAKAAFPRSGAPLYWEGHFTGYYYIIYKAYLGFYIPIPDGIRAERILPAKSDYGRLLLPRQ